MLLKRMGNIAYKVELLEALFQLHPIFHISLLKSFYKDPHIPPRSVSTRAPASMREEYNKVAEEIVAYHIIRHKNRTLLKEYLVQWHGLPKSEIS